MTAPALRLALDVAAVRAEPAGVGVYVSSLARALARIMRERLTLIGVRDEAGSLRELRDRVRTVPFHLARLPSILASNYHSWMMLSASGEARRSGANLVHYTNAAAPPFGSLPFVVTVHDLSVLRHPGMHPARRLATLPVSLIAVARARAVIVPSDWVRHELSRGLGVAARRVVVVEHAPLDDSIPVSDPGPLLRRHRLDGHRYLLSVGTIEPRKNLLRLVAAFELLAAQDADLRLVLAGSPGWRRGSIDRRIGTSPYSDRIVLTGYLSPPDVAALMKCAAACCYVSMYEGYGLPVIEAMKHGTPVVTSNRTSMPQAAGGAAVLVDPFDEAEIARGIRDAIARREVLAVAGPERAALRSWDDVAREHLAVYEFALRASEDRQPA